MRGPELRCLPETRTARTHKFEIAGHEGYLTVGLFDDGQPGELFITTSNETMRATYKDGHVTIRKTWPVMVFDFVQTPNGDIYGPSPEGKILLFRGDTMIDFYE